MAIPGAGCFVAWYDLLAGREADHDHWHSHEHMIERVAIPGFIRGLRYRSLAGSPRLCVIYQAESLATFTSPAYLERLNNPTPWSTQMLPMFVGMNRTLCTVAATHGTGIGGTLATIQLAPDPGKAGLLKSWLTNTALPELAAQSGLNGAHLLLSDRAASETKSQEKVLRGGPDAVADWIVLVEGYDRASVERGLTYLAGPDGLTSHGAADRLVTGLYSLDFALEEREAKAVWRKPA